MRTLNYFLHEKTKTLKMIWKVLAGNEIKRISGNWLLLNTYFIECNYSKKVKFRGIIRQRHPSVWQHTCDHYHLTALQLQFHWVSVFCFARDNWQAPGAQWSGQAVTLGWLTGRHGNNSLGHGGWCHYICVSHAR